MKRDVKFSPDGMNDYIYWIENDKKILKRINKLIKGIDVDNNDGLGKPEKLTGNYTGWWSRRIDEKNRLIYRIKDNVIEIVQCRSHYGEK